MFEGLKSRILSKKIKESLPIFKSSVKTQLDTNNIISKQVLDTIANVVEDNADEIATIIVKMVPIINSIKSEGKVLMSCMEPVIKSMTDVIQGHSEKISEIWSDLETEEEKAE